MRNSLWKALCLAMLGLNGLAQQIPGPAVASPPPEKQRINLDVLVTDKAGKPLPELEPFDLNLLDNDQPRRILSFRRTDGAAGSRFDPPVEVILVLDAVNLPYQFVTPQRLDLEKFLRLNNGQLAFPTSVFLFSNQGMHIQPAPSKDGNAVAKMIDEAKGTVQARVIAGGIFSLVEQFQDSFKALQQLAENEARKPGRKVIIWIGPGWPLLTERFFRETNESRQNYFHQLVVLTKRLREARITLYNVAPIVGSTWSRYKAYLKPVSEARKMEIADLSLQALAVQTGGRVVDPGNDLVKLILDCQNDVGPYYTITFEAPQAAAAGELHSLRVQVKGDGTTARTNAWYYNEP